MATSLEERAMRPLRPLPNLIFASRWLQLPLYLGLIIAQAVYVWLFWQELYYLLLAAMGSDEALQHVLDAVTVEGVKRPANLNETVIMLVVLGLIDVVMISNLLIMVIVGGYETFVSRLGLEGHPDQPEWLSHVNASVLKVKLATAIIGISSIHLLKTFINAAAYDVKTITAQVGIHITFLLSAIAIAAADRVMPSAGPIHRGSPAVRNSRHSYAGLTDQKQIVDGFQEE
jgi:uncharacterized protein (TIGR00645 family)